MQARLREILGQSITHSPHLALMSTCLEEMERSPDLLHRLYRERERELLEASQEFQTHLQIRYTALKQVRRELDQWIESARLARIMRTWLHESWLAWDLRWPDASGKAILGQILDEWTLTPTWDRIRSRIRSQLEELIEVAPTEWIQSWLEMIGT